MKGYEYVEFGDLLAEKLTSRKMTGAALARKIGQNPATVSNWMRGEGRPGNPEVIETIVRVLELGETERVELLIAAAYEWYVDESARRKIEEFRARATKRGIKSYIVDELLYILLDHPEPQVKFSSDINPTTTTSTIRSIIAATSVVAILALAIVLLNTIAVPRVIDTLRSLVGTPTLPIPTTTPVVDELPPTPVAKSRSAILFMLRSLAKQVTIEDNNLVAMEYSDAPEGWLSSLLLNEDSTILLHGNIPAGIDLSDLSEDDVWISEDAKRIQLRLSQPVVFEDNVSIDMERSRIQGGSDDCVNLACRSNLSEVQNLIFPEGKRLIIEDSLQNGILDRAATMGITILQSILEAQGFEGVQIVFSREQLLLPLADNSFERTQINVPTVAPPLTVESNPIVNVLSTPTWSNTEYLFTFTLRRETFVETEMAASLFGAGEPPVSKILFKGVGNVIIGSDIEQISVTEISDRSISIVVPSLEIIATEMLPNESVVYNSNFDSFALSQLESFRDEVFATARQQLRTEIMEDKVLMQLLEESLHLRLSEYLGDLGYDNISITFR